MTVGKVRDWNFPKHNTAPPRQVKYTYDRPRISGGEKLAKGGPFKHPLKKGALHRDLGIPQGQKIPHARLVKAEHSSSPLTARRARLAETMSHWNKKAGGGAVHGANCSCPMCSGGMVR